MPEKRVRIYWFSVADLLAWVALRAFSDAPPERTGRSPFRDLPWNARLVSWHLDFACSRLDLHSRIGLYYWHPSFAPVPEGARIPSVTVRLGDELTTACFLCGGDAHPAAECPALQGGKVDDA